MGVGRWLKKKGSTGSIARWVADSLKELMLNGSQKEVAIQILVSQRYGHPAATLNRGEQFVLAGYLRRAKAPGTARELARMIWDIEIGSQMRKQELAVQSHECYQILDEEVLAKGFVEEFTKPPLSTRRSTPGQLSLHRGTAPDLSRIETVLIEVERIAERCWSQAFGESELPVQTLHALDVIVSAAATCDLPQVDATELIESAALRMPDAGYREFQRQPEVRRGMLALFLDSRAAAIAESKRAFDIVQTILTGIQGPPSRLSEAQTALVVQATVEIAVQLTAARIILKTMNGPAKAGQCGSALPRRRITPRRRH